MKLITRTHPDGSFRNAALVQNNRTIARWWTNRHGKTFATPADIEPFQQMAEQVAKAGKITKNRTILGSNVQEVEL